MTTSIQMRCTVLALAVMGLVPQSLQAGGCAIGGYGHGYSYAPTYYAPTYYPPQKAIIIATYTQYQAVPAVFSGFVPAQPAPAFTPNPIAPVPAGVPVPPPPPPQQVMQKVPVQAMSGLAPPSACEQANAELRARIERMEAMFAVPPAQRQQQGPGVPNLSNGPGAIKGGPPTDQPGVSPSSERPIPPSAVPDKPQVAPGPPGKTGKEVMILRCAKCHEATAASQKVGNTQKTVGGGFVMMARVEGKDKASLDPSDYTIPTFTEKQVSDCVFSLLSGKMPKDGKLEDEEKPVMMEYLESLRPRS